MTTKAFMFAAQFPLLDKSVWIWSKDMAPMLQAQMLEPNSELDPEVFEPFLFIDNNLFARIYEWCIYNRSLAYLAFLDLNTLIDQWQQPWIIAAFLEEDFNAKTAPGLYNTSHTDYTDVVEYFEVDENIYYATTNDDTTPDELGQIEQFIKDLHHRTLHDSTKLAIELNKLDHPFFWSTDQLFIYNKEFKYLKWYHEFLTRDLDLNYNHLNYADNKRAQMLVPAFKALCNNYSMHAPSQILLSPYFAIQAEMDQLSKELGSVFKLTDTIFAEQHIPSEFLTDTEAMNLSKVFLTLYYRFNGITQKSKA